jgi:hypothetical protein
LLDSKIDDLQTSLVEIYIYDIASNTWATQQTTDVLGRVDSFYGVYDEYQPGIPTSRWNMCATAGVAPDGTSYNLYVFGGQNETYTPGDIWALSLPRYGLILIDLSHQLVIALAEVGASDCSQCGMDTHEYDRPHQYIEERQQL